MNEKELFAFMIRHYQVVNYELHKKENEEKHIAEEIENTPFSLPFRKEKDGIKYVSFLPSSYIGNHGYCVFHFTREAQIIEIVKQGIVLYHHDSGEYICSIENILEIFQLESEHMYNVVLYRDSNDKRLPSNYLTYYFNSIKCHIEKIKKRDVSSTIYFIGGKEGIDNYGAFAYSNLYYDINWTFELVEKYKEQIIGWKLLIEQGNLFWSEEKIELYYDYIIAGEQGNSTKIALQRKFPIEKFTNIDCLSWEFLLKHYEEIDFDSYIESGNINYDIETIYILYDNFGGNKLFWDKLLRNPSCVWTIELFNFICDTNDGRASLLQLDENKRVSVYNFISNSGDADLFDSDFLETLREGELQYGYSKDFNIENVKKNSIVWNKVVFDTFSNYSNPYFEHKGEIKTVWNYFAENKFIELTYELCKYLLDTEITMGDFSHKEYTSSGWTEYERYTYKINGFKVFRGKHIKNEHELKKIIADKKLLSTMFTYEYFNQDVVDYVVKDFFSNFDIESWHETVDFISSKNQHSYVDLGLSVYWATQNIGASNPLEYGEKFIWGEPYSELDIDEAKRYKQAWTEDMPQVTNKDRSSKYYGSVDIAKTRFDAAYMNWGTNWHMPRVNEFQELIDKCTWEEVNINDIRGYKITGSTGNHILLPYLFNIHYLTSMRHSTYPYIYVLLKGQHYFDEVDRLVYATTRGFIRPVFDKAK